MREIVTSASLLSPRKTVIGAFLHQNTVIGVKILPTGEGPERLHLNEF